MSWNFNIEDAPKGEVIPKVVGSRDGKDIIKDVFSPVKCLISTKCGKVIISWILENDRWMWLAKGEQPVAWQPVPEHATPEAFD